MDLSPQIPSAHQVVERYGPSGFRVSGVIWRCPVLVFPDLTLRWAAVDAASVTWDLLLPVVEHGGVQILLLGLGKSIAGLAAGLREGLRQVGIGLEPMDTGAACRTYNLLLAEDRRVAAALIPPV